MSLHRDAVATSRLFLRFDELAGFEKVNAAEVNQLKGLVLDVAECIGPHLEWIQFTFVQYTKHDLQHLLNIADHIHDFLPTARPDKTEFPVNALELAYLWLAILLHDIGMFVSTADEKQKMLDSSPYQDYLRHSRDRENDAVAADKQGHTVAAQAIRDALFAEFIRRQHAERVHGYIAKHLAHKLRFRQADLTSDIGKLCESHNWGVFQSRDSRHPEKCVLKLDRRDMVGTTPVNLAYLACCLRLGDILDFDRSRTPLSAFHAIHFSESISVEEWNKHLSIRGLEVTENQVRYVAECEDPADYVAVTQFLNWVDNELQDCTRLVREFPPLEAERYRLNLARVVDRLKIRMKNPCLVPGAFRFQLEYEQIMRLLMDKSLYPDETLFLRELLQNALDACRFQKAHAQEEGLVDKYIPCIQVWDGSDLPHNKDNPHEGPRIIFQDNGVGMSLKQVENFFMRVGKSYYRSAEFQAERERLESLGIHLDACSQFGIGFLSCFLGGDLIEVETHQHHSEPLKMTIKGPRKYFVIERLPKPQNVSPFVSPTDPVIDSPPHHTGTRITVYLREGWRKNPSKDKTDLVFKALDAVAVNQEFPITVRSLSRPEVKEIAALRWNTSPPRLRQSDLPTESAGLLIPSPIALKDCDPCLQGTGAIWFLDDHGQPVVRRGNLIIDSRGNVGLDDFTAALRDFCEWGAGNSRPKCRKVAAVFEAAAAGQLSIGEVHYQLQEIVGNTGPDNQLSGSVIESLCHGGLQVVLAAANALTKFGHNYSRWFHSRPAIEILISGNHSELIRYWAHYGVFSSRIGSFSTSYHVALFGIESPGGFQTWDAAAGSAARHDWLPSSISVNVDTYGSLAPQPAASRLFVPYERSGDVRAAVSRACLAHARQLWKLHPDSDDWTRWYLEFLASWDLAEILFALGRDATRQLIQPLPELINSLETYKPSSDVWNCLMALHSEFGTRLAEEVPWWSFFGGTDCPPISANHIQRAATQSGIAADQIEKSVESLSEWLGWDITKGRPKPKGSPAGDSPDPT